MEVIFNSLQTHNYQALHPLLDDSVKIPPIPKGMVDKLFPQMFQQLPSPESYVITSIIKEGKNTRTLVDFISNGKSLHYNFLFSPMIKILEFDLSKSLKVSVQKLEPTDTSRSVFPNKMIVPFQIHSGLIFVKAVVNGENQTFILDSGAPSLVINRLPVITSNLDTAHHVSSGVFGANGSIAGVNIIKIANFTWQDLELSNISALTVDLSHLEKETHQRFYGLIGYDVFKNYEITFNYKQKIITLVKMDNSGNIVGTVQPGIQPLCTVPITMANHVPIIMTKIGNREFRMGIDCGAWTNLLSTKYINELKQFSTKLKDDKLTGADKEIAGVKKTKIKKASIACADFINCNTVFSDTALNQLKVAYHTDIDGLIGYEFLKQNVISINFKKKIVNIF